MDNWIFTYLETYESAEYVVLNGNAEKGRTFTDVSHLFLLFSDGIQGKTCRYTNTYNSFLTFPNSKKAFDL